MVERDYDALLLDFGGVVLLNPVELHGHAERFYGLEPGVLDWLGPVDPATDELWRRMIDGELTEREYWAQRAAEVGRLAGVEVTTRDYMSALFEPARPELIRPEATSVATLAREAGVGVSILTNDMRAFHGPDWERGIEFFGLVDHVVDLSDTDFLKPDPRGFQLALEVIGVDPAAVLFVDDQPRNVDGAAAVGLDALWFDISNAPGAWTEVADRLGVGR